MKSAALAVLLVGCSAGLPAADPGPCADASTGQTWGSFGIGTCLAGPVDLKFFERDGKVWLAVANADPFRNFASGSVLLLDWASVDLQKGRNPLAELDAHALPTDPYLGGLVVDGDRGLVIATDRYTEVGADGAEADHDDALVVDVSDPASPMALLDGGRVEVGKDPEPIALDPTSGLAFVANLRDGTVSVLDTTTTPVAPVDVAPNASVSRGRFFDADASGSVAELGLTAITSRTAAVTDDWTLSWSEAAFRMWAPEGGGVRRYGGGGGAWRAEPRLDLVPADTSGLGEVEDPFYGAVVVSGSTLPALYFADDGAIRVAVTSGDLTAWNLQAGALVEGEPLSYADTLGAPSVISTSTGIAIYFDAREQAGFPAVLGRAVQGSDGAITIDPEPLPIAAPEGWVSLEDPFVLGDARTATDRLWFSVRDADDRWSIATSETEDGDVWAAATAVSLDEDVDVGAPVVALVNGAYRMWYAAADGDTWSIHEADAPDGLRFGAPSLVTVTAVPIDEPPPRVAMQARPIGGWIVEGRDTGAAATLAVEGKTMSLQGFSFRVASGHVVGTDTFAPDATLGVLPGSVATVDGVRRLYATLYDDDGALRLGALDEVDGRWLPVAHDLLPLGEPGNDAGVRDPLVYGEDGAFTLIYSAKDAEGRWRLRRATSADGLVFEPQATDLVDSGEGWDSLVQLPRSIQPLDGGGVRLWYSGTGGQRYRIGTAVSADGVSFTPEVGDGGDPWVLGTGLPGDFDDSGVRDPVFFSDGVTEHLWYTGFDGAAWSIGHASRAVGDTSWERTVRATSARAHPVLAPYAQTFAATGVEAPVLLSADNGRFTFAVAGLDGAQWRIGEATGRADQLWLALRNPTPGDRIEFVTRRDGHGTTAIRLSQTIDGFATTGAGITSITPDPDRGFLWLTGSRSAFLYVVDVRDDSADGVPDDNPFDLEAIVNVATISGSSGFRHALPSPRTGRVYATGRDPDAVYVFDASKVVDDGAKQRIDDAVLGALPLVAVQGSETAGTDRFTDAGVENQAELGGGRMALADDGRLLVVPHARDNSVSIFDLDRGPLGEQVAYLPWLGENPHVVAVTPDGKQAVVANFLGEVDPDGNVTRSTLAVIDVDRDSPTFLEVLTWITND